VGSTTVRRGHQAEFVDDDATARAGDRDTPKTELAWAPSRAWVVLGVLSTTILITIALVLTGKQLDFDVYRMGGAHVLGQDLYSVRLPRTEFRELFTYTPFAALMFWPAAHLPLFVSRVSWSLLNSFAMLALIGLSIKVARGVCFSRRVWVSALVCMLPVAALAPVALTLYYGQVNFLLVLMVLGDLTCVIGLRGHTLPRGVLVGVAAAIKLTPLIFIPFLLLTRQFRAALTALASFLFCTGFALALAPHSSWLYWTKDVFDAQRVGSSWFVSNQNLLGAVERLVGHAPSPVLLASLTLLFAVGGLLLAARAYRRSSPFLGVLLAAATGLMVSPISWSHHYVWIVPALAWLILGADRPQHWRWWAAGAAILFVSAPMSSVPGYLQHYSNPLQYAQGNAFFLATLTFVVLTSVMVWRREGRERAQPVDARAELVAP
jgi:alpha-1,2-mannosyltransferase